MSYANAEYRSESPFPEYTLTRRAGMRNIRMRLVPPHGEVRVSAAYGVSVERIDEFVASKQAWIAKRRQEMVGLEPRLEPGLEAAQYEAQLWEWLEELLPWWSARFEVVPPHVTLKIMRSQWGSCRAATHRITLNIELARRGYDLAEYVLVHELCHLYEMNHGPRFYALMDAHLPDWRERKAQLGPL